MRPGLMLSVGCLALLAAWRFGDGQPIVALVLLVMAATVAAAGLWTSRRAGPSRGPTTMAALSPSERDEAREAQLREARGWRRIALLGLLISIAGIFVFPPMSLVVAGLALYSLHRRRRCMAEVAVLERMEHGPQRQGC